MRILTVHPGPQFSVADCHNGWTRAFRELGCEVGELNLQDRLNFYESACQVDREGNVVTMLETEDAIRLAAKGISATCYEFWPDVLFVTSGFFVPPEILDLARARRTKVVLLHTEQPYELGRELTRAHHADLSLVNDPTHLHRFQEIGPAFYAPHCYDPKIHFPGPGSRRSDLCFVGTGYPSRVTFLEQVDWTGIDVALGGNWGGLSEDSPLGSFVVHDREDCLDNAETVDLYRGAAMSANLYRQEADHPELSTGWSMGPREVELAACGVPFLRDPRPEGDEVLSMLPTFEGPEDFEAQLRWWLAHPEARASAAAAAREAVAERTFTANAAGLLRALERL